MPKKQTNDRKQPKQYRDTNKSLSEDENKGNNDNLSPKNKNEKIDFAKLTSEDIDKMDFSDDKYILETLCLDLRSLGLDEKSISDCERFKGNERYLAYKVIYVKILVIISIMEERRNRIFQKLKELAQNTDELFDDVKSDDKEKDDVISSKENNEKKSTIKKKGYDSSREETSDEYDEETKITSKRQTNSISDEDEEESDKNNYKEKNKTTNKKQEKSKYSHKDEEDSDEYIYEKKGKMVNKKLVKSMSSSDESEDDDDGNIHEVKTGKKDPRNTNINSIEESKDKKLPKKTRK